MAEESLISPKIDIPHPDIEEEPSEFKESLDLVLDNKSRSLTEIMESQTRIEKYNLADSAFAWFLRFTRDPDEIAVILNKELARRREFMDSNGLLPSGFQFQSITPHDVMVFLKKIRRRIDQEDHKVHRKMARRSLDMVRALNNTLADLHETMGVWKEMFEQAAQSDDSIEEAIKIYKVIQKDREMIPTIIKTLSEIKTKVKTHITIDYFKAQVRRCVSVIEHADGLAGKEKEKMLTELGEVISIASIDEEYEH